MSRMARAPSHPNRSRFHPAATCAAVRLECFR